MMIRVKVNSKSELVEDREGKSTLYGVICCCGDKLLSRAVVNVIYEPCHWFSCFCAFSKVTLNVLDVIVVRKLSPSKLLCLPPHLIDCHLYI